MLGWVECPGIRDPNADYFEYLRMLLWVRLLTLPRGKRPSTHVTKL